MKSEPLIVCNKKISNNRQDYLKNLSPKKHLTNEIYLNDNTIVPSPVTMF